MYIYQTMSNNFGYIDIILLAMIAGFIILRLRNIMGRKTGHEEKIVGVFSEKKFEQFKKDKTNENYNQDNLQGEQRKKFLKGAEFAYEMIITAFAKGEQKKLDTLLTPQMSESFDQAISERNKNKIKSELTFIGVKESSLEKYEKVKNKIIEGNPDQIKTVIDYWKFSRNIFSKNPNWYLAEIITK